MERRHLPNSYPSCLDAGAPSDLKGRFLLPGKPGDIHVIPLSGGADSSALAVLMKRAFPRVPFRYLFTDTLADDPAIYETLARLERVLGIRIERLVPDKGLIELCESWGGFLPGHRSRYCTAQLKAKPFEQWAAALHQASGGRTLHTYVGIRADEDRVGLVSRTDYIEQHMPFKAWGIRRADVFRILEESGVGISPLYRGRTRSGCVQCPFQTTRELIYSLRAHPEEFARGETIERAKMTARDRARWTRNAIPLDREIGGSRNWMSLPIPPRIDARTAARTKPHRWAPTRRDASGATADLFPQEPMTELFVLAEFLVHPGVGDHGIWWQDLISFSTNRAGIQRQAEHHWWHRLATAETFGIDEAQMRDELNLAVYRLHLPRRVVDAAPPGKGSYTWKDGVAYAQLRHVIGWVERTLHAAGLRQMLKEYDGARPGTWAAEQADELRRSLAAIREPVGEVLGMDRYEPRTPRPPEEKEKEVTCFMCAL